MTLCSELADYEWLTGNEAGALLAELAASDVPLHTAVTRLRGRVSATRTHLLFEQVELRRRAAAKFTAAERMFFTRVGLEQASDEWVARYKAQRFRGRGRLATASSEQPGSRASTVADFCCGIGGDLMALAEQGTAIGVDRDPAVAHFAGVNTGATVQVAEVGAFDVASVAAWHIDPDRRATGHRTTSLEFCEPSVEVIERLLVACPNAAVKLAPATTVLESWAGWCELEWIGRDRQCRQLVAWFGELAHRPGQRSATVLPADSGVAPRTVNGAAKCPVEVAGRVDRFIFDVDAAVLAAHLKGALAAEHALSALGAGATYLTGPQAISNDAALTCFEVVEVLPLKLSQLAQYLRERGVGRLEIKKRGVEIEPEKIRRELKLRGENAATLLIANIGGKPQVVVARRVS